MSTISTTVNQGITLGTVSQTGTYASPLTIISTGYVDNTGSGPAIFGPNAAAWYVNNNLGTITATKGSGISLKAGGTVINSGHITGAGINTSIGPLFAGVYIGGTPGLMINSGTIMGPNGVDLYAGGTVVNSGLITNPGSGPALVMGQPGFLTVASTGTISGGIGVEITNLFQAIGPSTVVNSGTIIGSQYFANPGRYFGVYIGSGGTLVNNGSISGMVLANRGPLTIFDYGSITTPKGDAIYMSYGGSVTIGTFTNAGVGAASGAASASGDLPETEADVGGDIILAGAAALSGNFISAFRVGQSAKVGGHLIFLHPEGTSSGSTGAVSSAAAAGPTTSIVNYGTMQATSGYAISIDSWKATVTNGAPNMTSALISGSSAGVGIVNSPGTVTNFGTIAGTGGVGVILAAGSTLINGGMISGAGGTAVQFAGGGNLMVLDPGYKFAGKIVAVGTAASPNTLQLSGNAVSPLTVNYAGLGLTNFQDLLFGPAANATLDLSNTGGTVGVTISGFAAVSDVIDLTAIGNDGSVTASDTVNHRITISGSNGVVSLQLDTSDATSFTTVSDGVSGTNVVACFCRGTMMLTDRGEMAIEELAIGDRVVTLSGEAKAIRWIGQRSYDLRFLAGNRNVLPVCIAAGALGDGLPTRDLWVSPEHALYLDGVLAAARLLVNGTSIVQARQVADLEYFHIELATHDIIIAEGAPAETYVERNNRGMFHNVAEYEARYPGGVHDNEQFCAPRLEEGAPGLLQINADLAERAKSIGYDRALSVTVA